MGNKVRDKKERQRLGPIGEKEGTGTKRGGRPSTIGGGETLTYRKEENHPLVKRREIKGIGR